MNRFKSNAPFFFQVPLQPSENLKRHLQLVTLLQMIIRVRKSVRKQYHQCCNYVLFRHNALGNLNPKLANYEVIHTTSYRDCLIFPKGQRQKQCRTEKQKLCISVQAKNTQLHKTNVRQLMNNQLQIAMRKSRQILHKQTLQLNYPATFMSVMKVLDRCNILNVVQL